MNNKRSAGNSGEKYAAQRLRDEGYTVLCTGYSCDGGEIDIIATKENFVVFVEVKLRNAVSGDVAALAVDDKKLSRIRRAADAFLSEYENNVYAKALIPRIDVIELYTSKSIVRRYNHIENVQYIQPQSGV